MLINDSNVSRARQRNIARHIKVMKQRYCRKLLLEIVMAYRMRANIASATLRSHPEVVKQVN